MTAVGLQYLKTIGDETTINQGFNYVTSNEYTFPGNVFLSSDIYTYYIVV